MQRYGWDLAAQHYEPLWQGQLACAQDALVARASLVPGERVLDVACGTGIVSFAAAEAVGALGAVVGVDLSNTTFARMDGECLELPDASFDVALCALGLMYMPHPEQGLREMRRVLRPGGRLVVVVWGERSRCGWSAMFSIVDAELATEACPLFFRLGAGDSLAAACVDARSGARS